MKKRKHLLLTCTGLVALSLACGAGRAEPAIKTLPTLTATVGPIEAATEPPILATEPATLEPVVIPPTETFTPEPSPIPPTDTPVPPPPPTTAPEALPATPLPPQPGPASACPQGCEAASPGCEIKGNINREGEKIYHVPGGRDYDKTEIDPSKSERWFCSPDEAVANGWRASQR